MGRFFNREAAVAAAAIALLAVGAGLLAGLAPWLIVALALVAVALFHWPLTLWLQDRALEIYERRWPERALELALEIRDSAPTRRERERASLDVALLHMGRGDLENALKNLRRIVTSDLRPVERTVVDASVGYCLAHLGRDLGEAERLVQAALDAGKDDLFLYHLGLVRLRQGRVAEARDLIRRSLERVPDDELPFPGERDWALAQAAVALADPDGAREHLARAARARGRFGELARRDLAPPERTGPDGRTDAR